MWFSTFFFLARPNQFSWRLIRWRGGLPCCLSGHVALWISSLHIRRTNLLSIGVASETQTGPMKTYCLCVREIYSWTMTAEAFLVKRRLMFTVSSSSLSEQGNWLFLSLSLAFTLSTMLRYFLVFCNFLFFIFLQHSELLLAASLLRFFACFCSPKIINN